MKKKKEKKLYSENLNSKSKNFMRNETIKFYNIKYFYKKQKKYSKKIKEFLYTHISNIILT